VGAVLHTSLDNEGSISELLESSSNSREALLLEVEVSSISIAEESLSVIDTLLDLGEALGLEDSLEESFNDGYHLGSIIRSGLGLGSGGAE